MLKPAKPKHAKSAQKCIFCRSEAVVTSEHILSRRFHRLIPQTTRNFRVLRSIEYIDHSVFRPGKFNSDPRDWKVKCVCEANCNNGWMRKLEERLEPLLTALFAGQKLKMTEDELMSVATWAVMKAIVIDHIDPEEATTHHMQRYAVYANQKPPKNGWAIWLGHHPRERWDIMYRSAPFLTLSNADLAKRATDLATYYNSSIISYVIGELFVQVIHAPKPLTVDKWSFPIFPDGGSLRRIWPPTPYSLMWPPQAMSGRDVEVAFKLFRNFIARNVRAARYPLTL